MNATTEQPIIMQSKTPVKASVIWLHGLGADGKDFVEVVKSLDLLDVGVRFVLPHAPIRAVTINNGMQMRAWYDIRSQDIHEQEDRSGFEESFDLVKKWIEQELAIGTQNHQIILAGFSQGAAVSLYSALRLEHKLAGVMALSSYLPFMQLMDKEAIDNNRGTPLFMAHGEFDPVIPIQLAQTSREILQNYFQLHWQSYPMEHSVSIEEISAIKHWLQKLLEL